MTSLRVVRRRTVMDRPLVRDSGATLHFVDDRFETVEAVAAAFDGEKKIRVYLADWYEFVSRHRIMRLRLLFPLV